MDRAEIERYLAAALGHSIMIDVRELPALPGYVRTCLVHQELDVTIEFDRARTYAEVGEGPWGPKIRLEYDDLETLVADFEEFLELPIERWTNYTRFPLEPVGLDDPRTQASHEWLEELVRTQTLPLPRRAPFRILNETWEDVSIYGVPRDDLHSVRREELWEADAQEETAPDVAESSLVRPDGSVVFGGITVLDCRVRLRHALDDLDLTIVPEPAVSALRGDGWTLTAHHDGRVVLEHHADLTVPTRHLLAVSRAEALGLFERFLDGGLTTLAAEPWRPGYDDLG